MGRLVGPNGEDGKVVISESLKRLRANVPAAALVGAYVLETTWKEILNTPGRGRVYGSHQASAPGDPPAPDTRELLESVRSVLVETDSPDVEVAVRVQSDDPVSKFMEFGTLPRGRQLNAKAGRAALGSKLGGVAPRPHARPARAQAEAKMTQAVIGELRTGKGLSATVTSRG